MTTNARKTPKTPNVDESLFGSSRTRMMNKKLVSSRAQSSSAPATPSSSSSDQLSSPHTVVRLTDLRRMQQLSHIQTDEYLAQAQALQAQQHESSRVESNARKAKMIEKETQVRARREQMALASELEQAQSRALDDVDVMTHAHLDSVKRIQSLAQGASAFMAREAQLVQAQGRVASEEAYSRHWEHVMERDRVAELDARQVSRARAQAKRLEGRRQLEDQIRERERLALRAEEAKAHEGAKILELYQNYEREDERKREQHRAHVEASIAQVVETNAQIQKMKQLAKAREAEDERVAFRYLVAKAEEEEKKAHEAERVKKSKEAKMLKMRAQQEKVADTRAAQDELRAKRAYEAKEKGTREKEVRDREFKKAAMAQVMSERRFQERFKQGQAELSKRQESLTVEMARRGMEEEHARRQLVEQRKVEEKQRYKDLLGKQLEDNAQARDRARMFQKNANSQGKKQVLKEHIVVDKIRTSVLQKLQKEGVNEQYLRELRQLDISSV